MWTNQQLDAKEVKLFSSKTWEEKKETKTKRNAEMINNMKNELVGFKEGSEGNIY